MLQIALYLSCGATACYLWGRRIKGKADSYNSITRVADIKCLDDLLKEKATNLLAVVSGKVASATPFNCKHDDNDSSSGDVFEAKFEMGYETKLDDDGGLINKCHNFLFQIKDTPWYLEDGTGMVKVVRAELADGYIDILKPQFDMSSMIEIFQRFQNPQEGSKVICRGALDTGTSLTIVGEVARDEAGTLTIQKPMEQSFKVFSGEGSFDKMVANLKSNSEFYFFYSKIFGTIAVAIAVVKGVGFVRRVLRERAENADSDNEDNP
ncbi:E3 ubiquitin-protein ligase SP1-like [Raphanus sativus]|uniref:RING-type E3 ubiquitin transferase n=2 Tax=Raphanus sativus TaxID=3726 RepID=A0A9W3CAD9_RAPSA|nr:E3 ubiquitin-protein ligase SP1-like [Raphanus sativus]